PPGHAIHLDAARAAGADRILALVPSMPALGPAHAAPGTIRQLGLAAVWMQSQRQAYLQGLRHAQAVHRAEHPAGPVVVLEASPPEASDLLQTAASQSAREAVVREGL